MQDAAVHVHSAAAKLRILRVLPGVLSDARLASGADCATAEAAVRHHNLLCETFEDGSDAAAHHAAAVDVYLTHLESLAVPHANAHAKVAACVLLAQACLECAPRRFVASLGRWGAALGKLADGADRHGGPVALRARRAPRARGDGAPRVRDDGRPRGAQGIGDCGAEDRRRGAPLARARKRARKRARTRGVRVGAFVRRRSRRRGPRFDRRHRRVSGEPSRGAETKSGRDRGGFGSGFAGEPYGFQSRGGARRARAGAARAPAPPRETPAPHPGSPTRARRSRSRCAAS